MKEIGAIIGKEAKKYLKGLEIGQTLYDYSLKEYKVSKIGNKYFECEYNRGKFEKETLKYYSPNYSQSSFQLYTNKQEILDKKEISSIEEVIRHKIKPYGRSVLTLEQLREINKIITTP